MKKQFPGGEIVTWYLGSNKNAQLFGFIQVPYSSGCSRNMDAITMAHKTERKNVYSALSLQEDTSAIAHTRGRTVLFPVVRAKASTSSTDTSIDPSYFPAQKIIFGSELSETNKEPIFRLNQQKKTKNRENNRKNIFGSDLYEANNKPSFRLHHKKKTKSRKKNQKIIFGSELSEANNEPNFRLYQQQKNIS